MASREPVSLARGVSRGPFSQAQPRASARAAPWATRAAGSHPDLRPSGTDLPGTVCHSACSSPRWCSPSSSKSRENRDALPPPEYIPEPARRGRGRPFLLLGGSQRPSGGSVSGTCSSGSRRNACPEENMWASAANEKGSKLALSQPLEKTKQKSFWGGCASVRGRPYRRLRYWKGAHARVHARGLRHERSNSRGQPPTQSTHGIHAAGRGGHERFGAPPVATPAAALPAGFPELGLPLRVAGCLVPLVGTTSTMTLRRLSLRQ